MGLSQWKSLLAGSTVTIYYIINSHVEMFIYTLPSVIKAVGVGPVNQVTVGPVWKLISPVMQFGFLATATDQILMHY